MKDDKKIGVKSLSIKIENKSDQIIPLIFSLSLICISIAFFLNENGNVISKLISIFFIILFLAYKFMHLKKRVPYKKIFDSSVFTGSILSLLIFTQNYL